MEMSNEKKNDDELEDVEIVWMFDAPVEEVWKAFTDPEIEKQWSRCFTPVGSTEMDFIKHDLKIGGRYLHRSVVPWGKVQYITGVYRKIVPFKELAYTMSFADEKGNIISGRQMGMNYYIPAEWLVEIAFEEFQDGTRLRFIQKNQPANGHSDFAATEIAKSFFILSSLVESSSMWDIRTKESE